MSLKDDIGERIDQGKKVLDDFSPELITQVADVVELIVAAYRKGRKVVFMGNGGSAADAQHLATELVGRFLKERPALEAVALNTNTSLITALANDYGFEHTFRRQVEALAHEGDIVVGISTSGDSPNVLEALKEARRKGCRAVGMTGRTGGKMKALADPCLCVPADIPPRIQECHILIGHIICELVEKRVFEHTD